MRRSALAGQEVRLAPIAVALPAAAARASDLVWPALVALACAAAIAPLWSSELLPFQDAPQHLAAIRVLADFHAPGAGFEKWFEIDLMRLQYLGFYLPAAALAKVLGPDVACRVMLSLIALALPAAFWMLLGALGRDRRLAVFAPAVFHTLPLYLGFFNYLESIPAAIAVVALAERQLHDPTSRRAVAIGAGAAFLLWLHPSALAFAMSATALLALTSGRPLRRVRRVLAPWLPATALFGVWAVHAALARDGVGQAARTAPRWLPLRTRFLDLVHFGDVLPGRTDDLAVLALFGLFAAATVLGIRRRRPRAWRVPLLAAVTLLAYFAAPFDLGYMSWIGQRAIPFFILLAIASPLLAPGRVTSALCAAAVAVQIGYAVHLAAAWRAFDREAQATELDQVLAAAKPGKRLLGQIWEPGSAVVRFRPYMHFAAYYEVRRGGRAIFNFAETPWTPVRFRRGTEPRAEPQSWEWHPEWIDLSRAAAEEDYLLTRGSAPDPGGAFTLLAKAGSWSLYEAVRR
ncbi:MAG TPA: hypothetical protein VFA79_05865 [Myxococcales bacterium]|nr:hypothetical protein [Myxococcales bacterium]